MADDPEDIYVKLAKKRILFLKEDVDANSSGELAANLLWLNLQNKTKEITLYINSTGGDIDGLWTIYDTMQNIEAPIKTICTGNAFSSAAVILMAGTKNLRCAFPHASIMIHAIQLVEDVGCSQSEFEKRSRRYKKDNDVLMETMARHTSQSLSKVKKDCKEDYYLDAQEALKYGIIDQILTGVKAIPSLKK